MRIFLLFWLRRFQDVMLVCWIIWTARYRSGKANVESKKDDTDRSCGTHREESGKHIYDLSVMSRLSRIRKLYGSVEQMTHLLNIRMEEEAGRLDGIPGVKPQQFTFFADIETNQAVRRAYETMQNQYVLLSSDRIPFEKAVSAMKDIHAHLQESPAWSEYRVPFQLQLILARQ